MYEYGVFYLGSGNQLVYWLGVAGGKDQFASISGLRYYLLKGEELNKFCNFHDLADTQEELNK